MEDMVTNVLNGDLFRNRRVLVTGHTGFKGAWLCLWLSKLGARIAGVALDPPTVPSLFEVAALSELLDSDQRCDIRDAEKFRKIVDCFDPEIVFHLAAQSLVRRGYQDPGTTFDVNIMGTVNLLETVRQRNRPCAVIVVTSGKCYDNPPGSLAHAESDPMGGEDPYSASKGAAELVVAAYRRSYFAPERLSAHGIKLATVRAGNVIGGGDWAEDRIVPDIYRALSTGVPVRVRYPRSVRPWQHVLDCLAGYLMLAARLLTEDDPRWCDAWNFGTSAENDAQVQDIVKAFCEIWGGGHWEDVSGDTHPREAFALRLSSEKARCELGWRPRWHWREAVERAAKWYRAFYENPAQNMRWACENEIAEYLTTP